MLHCLKMNDGQSLLIEKGELLSQYVLLESHWLPFQLALRICDFSALCCILLGHWRKPSASIQTAWQSQSLSKARRWQGVVQWTATAQPRCLSFLTFGTPTTTSMLRNCCNLLCFSIPRFNVSCLRINASGSHDEFPRRICFIRRMEVRE